MAAVVLMPERVSFSLQGRDIVETSAHIPRLLHMAHTLGYIDLGVTLRSAYDTFRESVSAAMLTFLLDLCSCSVGDDPHLFQAVLAEAFLTPRLPEKDTTPLRTAAGVARLWPQHSFSSAGDQPVKELEVTLSGQLMRIDWLLVYHSRWWKKPRSEFQQLFTRVVMLSGDTRLQMGESKAARVISALTLTASFLQRRASPRYFTGSLRSSSSSTASRSTARPPSPRGFTQSRRLRRTLRARRISSCGISKSSDPSTQISLRASACDFLRFQASASSLIRRHSR